MATTLAERRPLKPHAFRRTLDEVRQDYRIACVDTCIVLDHFEDVPGSLVVEVGSHDESADAAAIIGRSGQQVIAVDLREPDHSEANQAYEYLRADFCDLPPQFIRHYAGRVDAIFSVSAIEHFGLGAYGERSIPYYDVLALRQMWQLLRPGGKVYLTVPYGQKFSLVYPHWYVYDLPALRDRLVADFSVELLYLFTSAPAMLGGTVWPAGRGVPQALADTYADTVNPHVTAFLKLVKRPVDRTQPGGK